MQLSHETALKLNPIAASPQTKQTFRFTARDNPTRAGDEVDAEDEDDEVLDLSLPTLATLDNSESESTSIVTDSFASKENGCIQRL